ncbi:Laccase-2 [Cytospora mali]|uniref:Laccase-2 n=1 Tax=Cytospora mali TaxID=578113 RepID=A0A194V879_CYTMA|nr:Laccase-2 [Valsa mali var. pyri (nom. inval.)]
MSVVLRYLLPLVTFILAVSAAKIPSQHCTNSPTSRSCWNNGYDINTDYYTEAPPGKLVEVSDKSDHGVTVHNNLTNHNGTAIHWHGIHLNNMNWLDGSPGVTQCPITVSVLLPWRRTARSFLTKYITARRFANLRVQDHAIWNLMVAFALEFAMSIDSEGLYGPLVIHGPSSLDWDVDLGPWLMSDWYHGPVFALDKTAQATNDVAVPDSSVLNGKGVYDCDPSTDPRCTGQGTYYEVVFEHGTKYKIGLINTGTLLTYTFYIDGHSFSVIEADFVPIEPYTTNVLNVGIGQRYEIIVEANATLTQGTNFGIHAQYCGLPSILDSRIGVVRYDANNKTEPPASTSHSDFGCDDPAPSTLVPIVQQYVGRNVNPFGTDDYMYVGQESTNTTWPGSNGSSSPWLWEMRQEPLYVNWSKPSVGRATGLTANTTMPDDAAPVYLDYAAGDWVYFVITSNFTSSPSSSSSSAAGSHLNMPASVHPMHLHGHDAVVLAQGHGEFVASEVTPQLANPARRDTIDIPIGGWVWIAFQVNNPGVWLLHCHIAWHSSDGFAIQFVEQPDRIRSLMEAARVTDGFTDRCDAWAEYYETVSVPAGSVQEDSGV